MELKLEEQHQISALDHEDAKTAGQYVSSLIPINIPIITIQEDIDHLLTIFEDVVNFR